MAEDLNFLMSGAETTEAGRQFQVLTVLGNKLLFLSSLALTDATKKLTRLYTKYIRLLSLLGLGEERFKSLLQKAHSLFHIFSLIFFQHSTTNVTSALFEDALCFCINWVEFMQKRLEKRSMKK